MEKNTNKEHVKRRCSRFGKIAVDYGFITPGQLKEALAEQVDDDLINNPHRVIGKIFLDKNWMTYQQIEIVLKALFVEHKT